IVGSTDDGSLTWQTSRQHHDIFCSSGAALGQPDFSSLGTGSVECDLSLTFRNRNSEIAQSGVVGVERTKSQVAAFGQVRESDLFEASQERAPQEDGSAHAGKFVEAEVVDGEIGIVDS